MQSDTIIGIVGAVVLVAVMVGVFAYEYSNAPEDAGPAIDPESEEGKMAAFSSTYPTLNATDDIDGDGEANYMDDDIDGDGVPNAEDNMTCVCAMSIGGTVAATSPTNTNPADTSNTFTIHQGATGGMATVTWTVTRAPGGTLVGDLSVSIQGAAACTKMDGTGDARMAMCDLTGLEPGTYTIRVSHASAVAQQKAFSGSYDILY